MKLKTKARGGFTLLELILVVTIIAVVGTVAVSRYSGLEQEAQIAMTLSNMGDVSRALDTYAVRHGSQYPDGWDSLLDVTTTPAAPTVYAGNGDPQQNSGVYSAWLAPGQISSSELTSMKRISNNVVGSGPSGVLVTVFDHDPDPTVTSAIQSTNDATARALATDDWVAFVDDTAGSAGEGVYADFGLTPDPTYRLLALGLGPHNQIVGDTQAGLTEAPVVNDVAPNQQLGYRRLVCLFKVFTDQAAGRPFAEFVGVVTSYGKTQGNLRTYLE